VGKTGTFRMGGRRCVEDGWVGVQQRWERRENLPVARGVKSKLECVSLGPGAAARG
jgi:hypothetical protein